MKITSFEDLVASVIVNGGITWLKTKLWWDFNINIPDEMIYKTYYELRNWCVRKNIVEFVDQDLLIEVIVEVIKVVESETDERLLDDPEYIKKSLKDKAWLWQIYSFFRDFVNKDNVKAIAESPATKAIDGYMNSVMVRTPELLDYKVHRDVDFAIEDYQTLTGDTGEVKIESTFTEELEGETLLGGFMSRSLNTTESQPDK